jgi:hypothetical protein
MSMSSSAVELIRLSRSRTTSGIVRLPRSEVENRLTGAEKVSLLIMPKTG